VGSTGRVLQRLVGRCCTRPWLTVSLGVLLAVLGYGYAAHSLALDTSKFQLLPSNQRWATLYQDYSRDFSQLEDIVVAVQSPSVEMSAAYAARLERELRVGELRSARVTYRIDPRHLAAHGLLYLPLESVRGFFDTLASQEDLLTTFAAAPSLDHLVEGINQSTGDLSFRASSVRTRTAGPSTPRCCGISWARCPSASTIPSIAHRGNTCLPGV